MVSEKVAHEERIRENGGFEKFPAFRKWLDRSRKPKKMGE
jgi:hypothetical protein